MSYDGSYLCLSFSLNVWFTETAYCYTTSILLAVNRAVLCLV